MVQSQHRILIHIPILHSQADMGQLGFSIRNKLVKKLGERWWRLNARRIDRFWSKIEEIVLGLNLVYEKVRVYQDGLPICGRENEIIEELAAAGSRNHQLLLRLMGRGATVMGTESAELLVEEYELVTQLLASETSNQASGMSRRERQALSQGSLKRRDKFIAERINATLQPGETGILFLGMLHSLSGLLAADVESMDPFLPRSGKVRPWKPPNP